MTGDNVLFLGDENNFKLGILFNIFDEHPCYFYGSPPAGQGQQGVRQSSFIIYQVQTKEIMTVTVFGHPILISINFDDFISPFSLSPGAV